MCLYLHSWTLSFYQSAAVEIVPPLLLNSKVLSEQKHCLVLYLSCAWIFCRSLGKCHQIRERFCSSFGPRWSIFLLRVSVVWPHDFTFTSPQSLTITSLHLIHAFTDCVSHLIPPWLLCKIASISSLKNMLDAVSAPGDALVTSTLRLKGFFFTAHRFQVSLYR